MEIHGRENIEILEKYIWWEIRGGSTNIWYEYWTKLGSFHQEDNYHILFKMEEIKNLINEKRWEIERLHQIFLERIVNHILGYLKNFLTTDLADRPWLVLNSTWKFKVSSGGDLLRVKKEAN